MIIGDGIKFRQNMSSGAKASIKVTGDNIAASDTCTAKIGTLTILPSFITQGGESYFYFSNIDILGVYTVNWTDGTKSDEKTVAVTSLTQFTVELDTSGIFYLYNEGDECTDVTGGWSHDGYTFDYVDTESAEKQQRSIFYDNTHSGGSSWLSCNLGTVYAVDLSGYDTLKAEINVEEMTAYQEFIVATAKANFSSDPCVAYADILEGSNIISVDVSEITEPCYIVIHNVTTSDSTHGEMTVSKVWLE